MPIKRLQIIPPPTIETLKQELKEADGIMSVKVETLLHIISYERAGATGRKMLIQLLRDNRIEIIGEMPASKYDSVRLFDLDLPSGDLYANLQTPGIEQDERLRELIDGDCRQKLRQIRAIVST
jgi:hypothetical protein